MLKRSAVINLSRILQEHGVTLSHKQNQFYASIADRCAVFFLSGENLYPDSGASVVHIDHVINVPEKIAALILSQLKVNKTVYARNCKLNRIDRIQAEEFLQKYHLLNSTKSSFNFGLFYKDELVAVASFSNGRKMDRLREDQRSFELIRFCSKSGITITGGLSKIIKNFCVEKKAGDVMTYVDKDLSDGSSFIRAGFKKHSETGATYFLVNKITFERTITKEDAIYDTKKFYRTKNSGNVKLVYTP